MTLSLTYTVYTKEFTEPEGNEGRVVPDNDILADMGGDRDKRTKSETGAPGEAADYFWARIFTWLPKI